MVSSDSAQTRVVFPWHNLVPVAHVNEGVVVPVPGFFTGLTSTCQDQRITEIGIDLFHSGVKMEKGAVDRVQMSAPAIF